MGFDTDLYLTFKMMYVENGVALSRSLYNTYLLFKFLRTTLLEYFPIT